MRESGLLCRATASNCVAEVHPVNRCSMIRTSPWLSAVCSFTLCIGIHALQIGAAGWGEGLISPYPKSDAAVYLGNAWFKAFVAADGGYYGSVLGFSPYVEALGLGYRLLGPDAATPYIVNAVLMSLGVALTAATAQQLFGRAAGWCAGAVGALCGQLVFFAGLTVKTNIEVPLLATGLLAAVLHLRSRSALSLFIAVSFLTLASTERYPLFLVLLAFLIVVLRHKPATTRWQILAKWVGISAFAMLCVLALSSWRPVRWTRRTFRRSGLNFYVANGPGLWGAIRRFQMCPTTSSGIGRSHSRSPKMTAVEPCRDGRPANIGSIAHWLRTGSIRCVLRSCTSGNLASYSRKRHRVSLRNTGHGAGEDRRFPSRYSISASSWRSESSAWPLRGQRCSTTMLCASCGSPYRPIRSLLCSFS